MIGTKNTCSTCGYSWSGLYPQDQYHSCADIIASDKVAKVFESGSICNDCSHFIWGPGGEDPAECKVLRGDLDYEECPGIDYAPEAG